MWWCGVLDFSSWCENELPLLMEIKKSERYVQNSKARSSKIEFLDLHHLWSFEVPFSCECLCSRWWSMCYYVLVCFWSIRISSVTYNSSSLIYFEWLFNFFLEKMFCQYKNEIFFSHFFLQQYACILHNLVILEID